MRKAGHRDDQQPLSRHRLWTSAAEITIVRTKIHVRTFSRKNGFQKFARLKPSRSIKSRPFARLKRSRCEYWYAFRWSAKPYAFLRWSASLQASDSGRWAKQLRTTGVETEVQAVRFDVSACRRIAAPIQEILEYGHVVS